MIIRTPLQALYREFLSKKDQILFDVDPQKYMKDKRNQEKNENFEKKLQSHYEEIKKDLLESNTKYINSKLREIQKLNENIIRIDIESNKRKLKDLQAKIDIQENELKITKPSTLLKELKNKLDGETLDKLMLDEDEEKGQEKDTKVSDTQMKKYLENLQEQQKLITQISKQQDFINIYTENKKEINKLVAIPTNAINKENTGGLIGQKGDIRQQKNQAFKASLLGGPIGIAGDKIQEEQQDQLEKRKKIALSAISPLFLASDDTIYQHCQSMIKERCKGKNPNDPNLKKYALFFRKEFEKVKEAEKSIKNLKDEHERNEKIKKIKNIKKIISNELYATDCTDNTFTINICSKTVNEDLEENYMGYNILDYVKKIGINEPVERTETQLKNIEQIKVLLNDTLKDVRKKIEDRKTFNSELSEFIKTDVFTEKDKKHLNLTLSDSKNLLNQFRWERDLYKSRLGINYPDDDDYQDDNGKEIRHNGNLIKQQREYNFESAAKPDNKGTYYDKYMQEKKFPDLNQFFQNILKNKDLLDFYNSEIKNTIFNKVKTALFPFKRKPSRKSRKNSRKKSSRKSRKKSSRKSRRKSSKKLSRKSLRKSPKKLSRKSPKKLSKKSPKKLSRKSLRKSPKKLSRKSSRKLSRNLSKKLSRKSRNKSRKKRSNSLKRSR
jgi:hypothetical protein